MVLLLPIPPGVGELVPVTPELVVPVLCELSVALALPAGPAADPAVCAIAMPEHKRAALKAAANVKRDIVCSWLLSPRAKNPARRCQGKFVNYRF
jgi:hypothetical protein